MKRCHIYTLALVNCSPIRFRPIKRTITFQLTHLKIRPFCRKHMKMFPDGHFVLLNSIVDSAGSSGGVTAVAFDSVEELLWTGNAEGHVTSYHGSALTKYTSFQMLDDEVRAFWFSDAGVLALGRNALKLCSRQGMPILSYNFLFEDMQFECLVLNPLLQNVLVLGGFQPTVIMFGLEVAEIVVLVESDCVVMKSTEKMLITGHSNGNICLRNPLNFSLLQELNAHSGSLSDFVIRGSHLVTCGFSQRDEDYSCDPFLVLHDLRTVSAIAPVNVLVQPSFLRFIPSDTDSVLVFGEFQIVNIGNVSDDYIYKIETQGTHCTAVDVSPSGQVIALADESGCLHVFVNRAEPIFVENARPLLMPDPMDISIPIGFDDVDTPLSAVPLPMTGVSSLSEWPAEFSKRTFSPALSKQAHELDSEIFARRAVDDEIDRFSNADQHVADRSDRVEPERAVAGTVDRVPEVEHGRGQLEQQKRGNGDGHCHRHSQFHRLVVLVGAHLGCLFAAFVERVQEQRVENDEHEQRDGDRQIWHQLKRKLDVIFQKRVLGAVDFLNCPPRSARVASSYGHFYGFVPDERVTEQGKRQRVDQRQLPIPQEVLKAMKTTEFVGYAPNVLGMRRNQVSYHLKPPSTEHGGSDLTNENSFSRDENVQKIPEHYRKCRKEYKNYHHIPAMANVRSPDLGNMMMGLEAPLRNSYVNSMILALYWVVPLRNTLLSHLCSRQFCLSCELSFLFSMLNRNPVDFSCNEEEEELEVEVEMEVEEEEESNNFIRSFRTLPEAFALGLVLNDKVDMPKENDDYKSLIQNFCRFILRHINSELKDERLLVKPKPKIQPDHLAIQVKVATPNSELSASVEAIETTTPKAEIDSTRQHFIAKDECQHESSALATSSSDITDTTGGIDFLFTMSLENITRCRCGVESAHHPGSSFVCTLSYPSHVLESTEAVTFETILENSLCLEQNTHAWCQKCLKFEVAKHYKRIQSLPDVLCINCNIDSDKVKQFWIAQQTYLNPETVEVDVAEKEFAEFLCSSNRETDPVNVDFVLDEESMDVENTWLPLHMTVRRLQDGRVVVARKRIANSSSPEPEAKDYILSSVITCIETNNSGHLVTCVNLPCNTDRQWFLINETHVKQISHKDAIKFDVNWKTPCVLFYSRLDLEKRHRVEVQNPIDERVFFQESVGTPVSSGSSMGCSSQMNQIEPPRYLPKRGDLVAMDAEFVTLNLEEAEVRSDGRKLTLKPSLLLAARVTCIYGSGPLKGTPIFDNYIITREHISDYQTKFSGIKPGDLDPTTSNKNTLVAMKTVYLKLRYFVDNGIKFVGHGLQNDFKVPPEQTVDTSNTHDSAEDAHSALVLYERYKEMTENKQNNFHNILNNLYLRGQQLHWTIPNS
ncbi:PAB-dependent poly(A)-specific ribonuclease subunit 2 [Trichinella murrelli]|uniref:PAB-dependent poly(A)-specific ribonuclease subunit 2 n=1 Tax=Trichinella murrelli TaxID=144512 RepID=A0A0V0TYZ6_9BILA|nr:PAB-dependent poly(A)-specific ribonuclease subunit 2 [Trichinella murrelli]